MDEQEDQPKFSIEELAELTGVPTRTIRYYITTRLITGPTSRGKQASYGRDHLLRLQVIRKLTAQYVPLEEIARRLDGVSTSDLAALLAETESQIMVREEAARAPSPRAYIQSLLHGPSPIASPAQAARYQAPPAPRHLPDLGTPPSTTMPVSSPVPPGAMGPAGAPVSMSLPAPKEVAWKRWELAPGLELHVEAGREATYTALIDSLLRLAAARRD